MDGEFRIGYKGVEHDVVVKTSNEFGKPEEDDLEQVEVWLDGEMDSFHPHTPKTELHHAVLEVVYEHYGISPVLESI